MSDQRPLEVRFWQRVAKPSETSCWPWTGAKTSAGYGVITKNGKRQYAHRTSYEINTGPIPASAVIDHRCHNPSCVNPSHLQAVSQKQNCENVGVIRSDSKSGVRGVGFDNRRGMYRARVHHFRREIHVGYFDTLEAAEAAAITKRNELFTNNIADRKEQP